MSRKITESDRILVSCTKDGSIWYMWHKALGRGKINQPVRCGYDKLAETLKDYAKKVGKIK